MEEDLKAQVCIVRDPIPGAESSALPQHLNDLVATWRRPEDKDPIADWRSSSAKLPTFLRIDIGRTVCLPGGQIVRHSQPTYGSSCKQEQERIARVQWGTAFHKEFANAPRSWRTKRDWRQATSLRCAFRTRILQPESNSTSLKYFTDFDRTISGFRV